MSEETICPGCGGEQGDEETICGVCLGRGVVEREAAGEEGKRVREGGVGGGVEQQRTLQKTLVEQQKTPDESAKTPQNSLNALREELLELCMQAVVVGAKCGVRVNITFGEPEK